METLPDFRENGQDDENTGHSDVGFNLDDDHVSEEHRLLKSENQRRLLSMYCSLT